MATDPGHLTSARRRAGKRWMCLVMWLLAASPLSAQYQYDQFDDYDLIMFDRPRLIWVVERSVTYTDGLAELWAKALARPDAELQRLVIDTLATARERDIPGIEELKPRLVELASQPDQDLDVLRALASTLIAFNAKDQVELLADLARRHGAPIAQIVEPAIGQWMSPVLEETWLERIRSASSGTALTVQAIDGLAAIRSQRASEPLARIVENAGELSQVRVAAARGLGELVDSGLVDRARNLASRRSQPGTLHPILAIELLRRHSDPEAIAMLTSMLEHDSSAVQADALAQLYRIDSRLVDQQREQLITSKDVNVRRWCLLAMVDQKQADRSEQICRILDDVNPTLRRDAAKALIELAQDPELRDAIIEESTKVLAQTNWRGCEQACVVLTRLDHKPCGRRLVELLGHQRGEVQVASAWGLTKLRLPDLLPDMLDHAQSVYDGFRSQQLNDGMPGASLHIAHLFNAFGDQDYRPAEPLMKEYLPKDHSLGLESRAAAAWAIGLFHEGDLQPELVTYCVGRLYDNGINPDSDILRDMCAVALGRMNAESALGDLRKIATSGMPSCYWAIEKMTGEKPPQPDGEVVEINDWFLSPLPNRD